MSEIDPNNQNIDIPLNDNVGDVDVKIQSKYGDVDTVNISESEHP